ncbi:class II fructose-bisphosphate aldolase [Faecalicoccus pleomorphus]|uniref:class II fructose-bisphosphate aldolase n=1 Tax=Faecalicoccus pleomorphus TaxID=1323 RepID=UPI00232D8616|nr:class II fructose-bisphosphate aldolase [Faecalicoccus pleomorphus]MDB7987090.1 class II fructose-bisphosphate aldolase [Faecalicoccus pleomorphus]MDB7990946.1 class II fructose-bisphosphate aldolase [Faecalicoccus pleomorphus]
MLVNTREMLLKANDNDYAIPSPDFINQNMIRDYIEVAEEIKSPALISISEGLSKYMSLEDAYAIAKYYANKASIPVALHLDHGKNVDFVKRAIDIGFPSVMIDASSESFEENVARTKEIVEYAHKKNVTVEAEIGHVGSGINYEDESGDTSVYTEVEDLVKFVKLTNVDSVAVSVGTAHGKYIGTPKINFERLKELKEAVCIPLVLHGGSSTGDENLKKCAEIGISKINIFTDICVAGGNSIKGLETDDYKEIITKTDKAMKDMLKHYYEVFNCQERN